uniref:hypothetical protein n=1 Tax=uncultured Caulobacter sp. TaxID=158749 RepID=UPI0025CD7DD7|nr:hypothetical protein [uncultured Caulobacter sp.]
MANDNNQGNLPRQQDDRQQAQPGQQNQQGDRDRRPNEGVEGTDQNGLNQGSATGGNGDLRPDQTDVGAER